MKSDILTVVSILALASSALAQDAPKKGGFVAVPSDNGRSGGWVEIAFPFAENSISDAIEDSISGDKGFQGSMGWEPFTKFVKRDERFAMRLLKSIGIGLDITDQQYEADFNRKMYDYEYDYTAQYTSARSCADGARDCRSCSWEEEDCWGTGEDRSCTTTTVSGYCGTKTAVKEVMGRDAYVKYSSGSWAIRAYIPIEIADRIQLQGGVSVRFHSMHEVANTETGSEFLNKRPVEFRNRTDAPWGENHDSIETTVDAILRVGVRVKGGLYAGMVAEKSVRGMGYRSISGSLTYRFPKFSR